MGPLPFMKKFTSSTLKRWFQLERADSLHFDEPDVVVSLLNYAIFITLLMGSIFINKYVLSILGFTYPTVFQGWQTLVGVLLLKSLVVFCSEYMQEVKISIKSLTWNHLHITPYVLAYVCNIVSGSKMLAGMPIPVFLSFASTIPCLHWLVNYLCDKNPPLKRDMLLLRYEVSSLAVVLLSGFLLMLLLRGDSSISVWNCLPVWIVVYIVSSVILLFHGDYCCDISQLSSLDLLYISYVFSVVVLTPASLYLEEAFQALNFKHMRQLHFSVSCLLSGVLAVALNLWTIKMSRLKHNVFLQGVSKVFVAAVSLWIFPNTDLSYAMLVLVSCCLIGGLFLSSIQCTKDSICEGTYDTESGVSLLKMDVY